MNYFFSQNTNLCIKFLFLIIGFSYFLPLNKAANLFISIEAGEFGMYSTNGLFAAMLKATLSSSVFLRLP